MEKQKQLRQILTGLDSYKGKAAEKEAEIKALEAKQSGLAEAALRAEVLGDPDWRTKKAAAESNETRLAAAKAEHEKSKKAIEILNAELPALEVGVMDEIRAQFQPVLEKALRAFVKSLRETAATERQIETIQKDAEDTLQSLGIRRTFYLEVTGSAKLGLTEKLGQVVARCKLNNFQVE